MKPLPFQSECLNELDWLGGRAMLAADRGLGKTAMACWHLLRHRDQLPAVVVCPASCRYQWHGTAIALGLSAAVAEGREPVGIRADVVVVGWDCLCDWRRKGCRPRPGQAKLLRRPPPRTVVVDECHYAASSDAKRTGAIRRLCKGVPHILALSGTPIVNRPVELWPVVRLLWPGEFESRLEYLRRYCGPQWTPWGWDYKGASNLDELHGRLVRAGMVRRRKEEVLADLPAKMRDVVPLPMTDPAEYAKAEDDFLGWLAESDPSRVRRAARAEAFTRTGYLLRLAARLKLPAAAAWVADWLGSGDGKLIVFARHRAVLDHLQADPAIARLTEAVRIDGGVTGMARMRAVERFRRNDRARLLLGNVVAAGTGVDGLQVANTVAFAELGWTPGEHLQAEDRAHRIGTTETVWAHYLVARGTIEVEMCKLLQRKQEVLSAVLDGGRRDGDLDVFDLLLGNLLTRARMTR